MQIKIDSNFADIQRQFANMRKQVTFAGAVALTKTAQDVRADIPRALESALDNPTDYTKRGTFLIAARRDTLTATVGFKDRQARYMALQIAGGVRSPGPGGIKLPGEIQLNAFGNIPKGLIAKLKAAAQSGGLSAALTRRLGREINSDSDKGGTAQQRLNLHSNRRKRAAPIQLFYGQPTGDRWKNAPVGIWRRIPPATPGGKGKLVPVIVFENTPAVYRAKFDMAEVATRTAAKRFGFHFNAAFSNAIKTAR